MKILVTGGTGYLGKGIVENLVADGHEVIAPSHKECDILSVEKPYAFFGEPDVLLHLAWHNGFVHNNPSHIEELPLHFGFINKMADGGVKRIVVMGSMHEVGFFEGSIKEDTPTNPQSLYGIAKDALRNATLLVCKEHGIPCQWLRGFYVVGNTESGSSVFSKITAAEKAGQKLFPFTSGQNQWDFLDYDVFCRMVAATVEQEKITGIINICSGFPEKLADRTERFLLENGYKIKLDYGKFADRPYDSKAVWGDNKKIEKILADSKNKPC